MSTAAGRVKKSIMLMIWRFQQVYGILAIMLWAMLLTLSAYDKYVLPIFKQYLGIQESQVALGLTICFLMVMGFLLLLGLVYDRLLRLWVEQTIVSVERNPYAKSKLTARDIVQIEINTIPLLRELSQKDPYAKEKLERLEKWIKKSLDEDANLKRDYNEVIKWIES